MPVVIFDLQPMETMGAATKHSTDSNNGRAHEYGFAAGDC